MTYQGDASIKAVFKTSRLNRKELQAVWEQALIAAVDRVPCDIKVATVQVDVKREKQDNSRGMHRKTRTLSGDAR